FDMNGKTVKITQRTKYPVEGAVKLTVEGTERVAVRIPAWCDKWSIRVNGKTENPVPEKGYIYLPSGEIELDFDMTPYAIETSPHVQDDSGRVAIKRGPVVYCLEGVDNGADLRDIHIDLSKPIESEDCSFCGLPTLKATGWRRDAKVFDNALYVRRGANKVEHELHFVPYFAFANRGETEMIIWILP
ncbi:MAG: glycoside hydrolase family 127 protein, partial [Clostridia bacterium]|nr:glycoside hydrolase family 127 protein [Clostridia bacterium]